MNCGNNAKNSRNTLGFKPLTHNPFQAQRKLFFNLRSQKKRLAWLNNDEVHRVAESLGVEPREVREMESRS